jgi:mRNA interferase RelE/StbE
MRVEYRKNFLRELAKIPAKERKEIENLVFNVLPNTTDFYSLRIFEQMKGYPSYYKARVGDYRIGVQFHNDLITLEKVLHRKEIYRHFP